MKVLRLASATTLLGLLAACGGGGGGSSNPPPPPPPPAPSALSYPAPPTFTVGTAIAQLNPTVTGTPTSYTVSPGLPAGLALNGTSGAISGTPTAVQAATNHTVTATNSGGSTTASVSIRVNDVAPAIAYANSTYSFTTELPITAVTPTATGGAIVTWTIAPALPAGLAFSATTGAISGTPTAASAASNYVITATNSGGSDTFDLAIGVQSAVLFDFGHSSVDFLQHSNSRLLSVGRKRAILWNTQTRERVRTIDSTCNLSCFGTAALYGNTLVERNPAGFEVYSASDGSPLAHIDAPVTTGSKWTMATDGSYIVDFDASRLSIWSNAGNALLTRTGDYHNASVFAAAGELRIARGPAGANVIETIALPGGTSTTSPQFTGSFHSWFLDGERFFTLVGGTVSIFSKSGVLDDIAAVGLTATGQLAGSGDWFWLVRNAYPNGETVIYSIGASTAPAATYVNYLTPELYFSNGHLAIVPVLESEGIKLVDLSGTTPVATQPPIPVTSVNTFAVLSNNDLFVGNSFGAVIGGIGTATPRIFSYGWPSSITGSSTRVSAAMAGGAILNFDLTTRTLENEIDFLASKVKLSADGTILGALASGPSAQHVSDLTLKAFSLPARNVLREWPAIDLPSTTPAPYDFDMSADGNIFALASRFFDQNIDLYSLTQRAMRIDDTTLWLNSSTAGQGPFSNGANVTLRLSPSGNRVALATAGHVMSVATNIYTDGVLSAASYGWPVGWLDDNRLLVDAYKETSFGTSTFDRVQIVSAGGQIVASPALPELFSLQSLGGDLIYVPEKNTIANALTAETVWSSPTPVVAPFASRPGAVAGGYVFFATETVIRAEPR
jgi:hypothetical protein